MFIYYHHNKIDNLKFVFSTNDNMDVYEQIPSYYNSSFLYLDSKVVKLQMNNFYPDIILEEL